MRQLHPVEITAVYTRADNLWLGGTEERRDVFLGSRQLSASEVTREETQRVLMYDLYLGAQALKLALKFMNERKEYFESLYDFSYGVSCLSDITDQPVFIGNTESHAMRIIDEKEAYDKRIEKLMERYRGFKKIIGGLSEEDQHLLIRYFEYGHRVDYEQVRACINRLSKLKKKEIAFF